MPFPVNKIYFVFVPRTTMRRKIHLLLFVILITTNLSAGKDSNKNKTVKVSHKNIKNVSHSKFTNVDRNKRSIDDDEDDKPFWAHRGKKQSDEDLMTDLRSNPNLKNRILKAAEKIVKDPPFWGNRGRRDSSSVENFVEDMDYPIADPYETSMMGRNCKHCNDPLYQSLQQGRSMYDSQLERRDEMSPFWGNRGRRTSDEIENDDDFSPFWGNRGRRQEDDPFWGTRGRREEEPFWGNRGRREELPFWSNRGREARLLKNWEQIDEEPFWGNRGRRRDLKDSIRDAISDVEEEIVNLSKLKSDQSKYGKGSSHSTGRESSLKHLFDGKPRQKMGYKATKKAISQVDPSQSSTVHDDRMYVDEPHYIIVERSSRSSGEVDPFYISRGKKMNHNKLYLEKAARDRRGAIEEIVKSVKNDPYFIVRGKKDSDESDIKADNSTALHKKYAKAKELICATVNILLLNKNAAGKDKREGQDSDRGRRAILNKLAAQLQIDPYFVSRGKKNNDWTNKDEYLAEFLDQVSEMCN